MGGEQKRWGEEYRGEKTRGEERDKIGDKMGKKRSHKKTETEGGREEKRREEKRNGLYNTLALLWHASVPSHQSLHLCKITG